MCPDHVHMLVEIAPKISVSSFMGYLKGKSITMLYEQFGEPNCRVHQKPAERRSDGRPVHNTGDQPF